MMERRAMLSGMGAAALSAMVSTAHAQQMADMPGMDHRHGGTAKFQSLIDSAGHCSALAELCLNHCLAMLAAGDKSLSYCASTSRELAVVCSALHALAAQEAPQLAVYAKAAADICRACEAECRKHPQHPPCVRCAEACAACALECHKLA